MVGRVASSVIILSFVMTLRDWEVRGESRQFTHRATKSIRSWEQRVGSDIHRIQMVQECRLEVHWDYQLTVVVLNLFGSFRTGGFNQIVLLPKNVAADCENALLCNNSSGPVLRLMNRHGGWSIGLDAVAKTTSILWVYSCNCVFHELVRVEHPYRPIRIPTILYSKVSADIG